MNTTTTLFRNDDVSSDTDVNELAKFCELFDRRGLQLMHAVTVYGPLIPIHNTWTNDDIYNKCRDSILCNQPVIDFMKNRKNDMIATHGMWHYHHNEGNQFYLLNESRVVLQSLFDRPISLFVPPFNEASSSIRSECLDHGVDVWASEGGHLELELDNISPQHTNRWRCHSWRFTSVYQNGYQRLDQLLGRICGR